MRSKIISLWQLLWAKHYVVLLADSEQEIGWALITLQHADDKAKLQQLTGTPEQFKSPTPKAEDKES